MGGGGWPWLGVVPGAVAIDADGRVSEAVALGDKVAAVVELVAAAVGVLVGSGGGGGGGIGGGDDMVETQVADTKVLGARVLPGLGRRQ